MRVGIYLDLRNPPRWRRDPAGYYAWTLDLAAEADRLGAGSIWVTEHHLFEDGYLPQPLTFAAALAARTSRARLGTSVLLAPLRRAIEIVEEAAIVDLVSGGRLELGLGAGYRVPEFAAYGADFEARHRTLGERAREIQTILEEGRVTPAPVQQPLPLWLSAMSPVGARRAARLGLGMLNVQRPKVEAYVRAWKEAGHDPAGARAAGAVHMILADDPDEAFARAAPHIAYQWDSYNRYMVEGTDRPLPPPVDPTQWRKSASDGAPARFPVLTADEAIAELKSRFEGLPIEHAYLWGTVAGMPEDLAERHVELVCTVLAPALAST